MQPLVDATRAGLTGAQVVSLIQDSAGLIVGNGAELLDMNLTVLADLGADFAGGSVSRNSYATLHGTAQLGISTELDWGSALVRPYITLDDGTVRARFNLGAYFTSTPAWTVEESPHTYAVQGYDILHGLNDPVGEAYAVDAGTGYLAAVEEILLARGYTQYIIDQSVGALALPSPKTWMLDNQIKWLTIVNDLLAAVGYAGIWSDWDGRLRCLPYNSPRERAAEWAYVVDLERSMLAPGRGVEDDYFEAPNRWVVFRANNIDEKPLVEGDGIYTFTNESQGRTSVEARGRTISRVESVDAADQASLVSAAQSMIDADLQLKKGIKVNVAPNPLHWHFDRLAVTDPGLSGVTDTLCTQWTLPLSGEDGAQEWAVL